MSSVLTKRLKRPPIVCTLSDEGAKTRLTVQDAQGGEDKTGVAPNILSLLAEQPLIRF